MDTDQANIRGQICFMFKAGGQGTAEGLWRLHAPRGPAELRKISLYDCLEELVTTVLFILAQAH